MERETGIEPATSSLGSSLSTYRPNQINNTNTAYTAEISLYIAYCTFFARRRRFAEQKIPSTNPTPISNYGPRTRFRGYGIVAS